jgi:parvulin-like peptidyl-prolyl isomerase
MKLKLILSATLIAAVISAHAATSGATNAAPKADAMTTLFGDPVIAKGKGFEIKRSDLDTVVTGAKANAAAQGQMLPPGFDISILNQLITIQLLVLKATPADRAAGQAESDSQFTNMVAHFGSPEAFARQLKVVGMSETELRAKATQEATAKTVLKRELKITVTPAEVRDCYTNHSSSFEEPEKAHVQHILLMTMDPATRTPLSTNAVAAKRKQADDLLKRIKGGADFAKLAKEFSEDPGSKINGGDLPKFGRGDMVAEFEAAAFALKPGQVSDVITTMFGFHIIKLLDKTAAKKFGFTETIPMANNETPEIICKRGLEAEKIKEQAPAFVQKLRAAANVEILDPNLKALEQAVLQAETNAPPAGNN